VALAAPLAIAYASSSGGTKAPAAKVISQNGAGTAATTPRAKAHDGECPYDSAPAPAI
jgi:hypothetical protein